ncbi:hypothetical protein PV328_000822 [Microctonus aethiopoides]|uniref:Sodium channel and clathrin linker 1 n=1 Tax=Microctonus aethiopoides TaxID=144406 RepID=A0AA39KX07_9HYME|nr:hypothetical protein PV328_000822 [Microctonus aethiopoides]
MIETEVDKLSKNGIEERKEIIEKYEGLVESLQQELTECKVEQARIREQINDVICENKNTVIMARESFHCVNNDKFHGTMENHECIENLQKQIQLLQLEKDSMFELWQMALKAVDTLEQELIKTHKDEKITKYYEEQVNNIKETYSTAITALETKLIQVKENFVKQQTLWHSTREQIDKLTREKTELEGKLINLQNNLSFNEETNRTIIEQLKSDLDIAKQKLETLNISKVKLENELTEARYFTTRVIAKDKESKEKVAEAIELVETAVREKEIILQREAMVIDEKTKLETRLANLSDEFMKRLDIELTELKENFEKDTKKYITQIKELKAELRIKTTKVDQIQCEYHLVEKELEKMRHDSEHYLTLSNSKLIELEQKFKDSQIKLENCEESLRQKFNDKIHKSENRIVELEEKLANTNDRLRRLHVTNAKDVDEQIKESDERIKEAIERCSSLEKRLSRALDEREDINSELRSLQLIHNREIIRRENERRILENRIRELQDSIREANELVDKSVNKTNMFEKRVESLEKELERKNQMMVDTVETNVVKCVNAEESVRSTVTQQKYEKKISELTRYVKIHQKLSAKWKEEAQLLASKFHDRYKELRSKMNLLKRENEILNNELASRRQQVVLHHAESKQRYDHGDSAR